MSTTRRERPAALADRTLPRNISSARRPVPVDRIARLFEQLDVTINGDRPWDIRIRDDRALDSARRRGITGLGDAYVEGWWDCPAIDQLFDRALRAEAPAALRHHPRVMWNFLPDRLVNRQTPARAFGNGRAHYNRGLRLFSAMLDRRMTYSCGYWAGAETLDQAQEAKLDLVCRKLGLQPGMRLLDIGCGWGSLLAFAAERYGVRAVGVTVSDDQASHAESVCRGLDVEVRIQDYRSLQEPFDRIASVGMFEHVGARNHRTFMRVARRCLRDDGLMLLHTIATRDSFPNLKHSEADWIERNIFPGMLIPSLKQIGTAIDGVFVAEDLENFGADYDRTLMAWHANFEAAWPTLAAEYDERFRRLWRYYLLCCAGAFRSRAYQLWQIVLSPMGIRGGYHRPLLRA